MKSIAEPLKQEILCLLSISGQGKFVCVLIANEFNIFIYIQTAN